MTVSPVLNDFRNILFETVDHGKIGESRTLRHNRIGVVQQEGERCHAGLLHRPQHPRRGDAALRDIENQDFAIIAIGRRARGSRAGKYR